MPLPLNAIFVCLWAFRGLLMTLFVVCWKCLCLRKQQITNWCCCMYVKFNWSKESPQKPYPAWENSNQFYWSCSSVVMNDDTPLTTPSAWAELYFQSKQHIINDPWRPEKKITSQWCSSKYGATFYSHHTGTKRQLL